MNSNDRNILSKAKLQEIVNQIDPRHTLDPEVEEILLEIADDFIENITHMGCTLAKHRGSNTLEVKDIQLNLEKNWNVKVPGYSVDALQPHQKQHFSDYHKQNISSVKKASIQLQKENSKKKTPSSHTKK